MKLLGYMGNISGIMLAYGCILQSGVGRGLLYITLLVFSCLTLYGPLYSNTVIGSLAVDG